jgi:hypothetical protein
VLGLIALTLVLLATPFFLTAAALGIDWALPSWAQLWGGFLIVFFLMVIGAGILGYLGFRRFRRIRAPQQTIDTVRDTAQALRRRGGSTGENDS